MVVVDFEPYWYIKHLKSGPNKVRNIGDRVFSKLYDFFKNHSEHDMVICQRLGSMVP